jgi:hypothetical protein
VTCTLDIHKPNKNPFNHRPLNEKMKKKTSQLATHPKTPFSCVLFVGVGDITEQAGN